MGLTTSKISNLPGQKSEGGGGQFSPFNTSTTSRSFEGDACFDSNDGQFYTQEYPPQPVIPFVGAIIYTDAAGTGHPEEGYYSHVTYGMQFWYELNANGEVTSSDMCL